MGLWLKQSTAVDVLIGPFVDSTDGNTTEEALTIEDEHVLLSKLGQALAAKNDANNATHDDLGYYNCPLNATDTNTLGTLQLCVHMAGTLPVYHEYMVVPANVWDSLFGADKLDVNTVELANIDFGATMKASINTEVDNALNTAIPASNTADSVNDLLLDHLKGESDSILADTNELQTDWADGGRLDLLIDSILADTGELQTDWANGGRLDLLIDAIKAKTDLLVIADIVDAIFDETLSAHSTADSAGLALDNGLKVLKNKWAISGTTLTYYDDDGVSTLYSFTLDDADAPTSRTPA